MSLALMRATIDRTRVGKAKRAHHLSASMRLDGGHATLCPPYNSGVCGRRDGRSILCVAGGQITQQAVQPFAQKYSAFASAQISRITPLVSPRMRGLANVTNAR